MYHIYGDCRFERLANLSVSHLYNLKRSEVFRTKSLTYTKTNPTTVAIGERRKPEPNGIPGFIRIDSVHQGDLEKEKGVYYINLVDEVTQYEVVVSVQKISEQYLVPALLEALNLFPFEIKNFHSDNGSEYINHVVARLLEKLRIHQTKSRSRHSNDNALAEGKNGAIIRTVMGYAHIPQKFAFRINQFCRDYLTPFLNFHRPCAFAVDVVDAKGKVVRTYPQSAYQTPWQKLRSLLNIESFLKPGVTLTSLETLAEKQTHLAAATDVETARAQLFKEISRSK
ncbi:MAG: transposase family protein [Candidatus Vogelbacteria bacterium]|nr:transposase family protein [Candidatus Vogelbacteria bacterium]